MATQPTNLPVPSESPRDLKFNAGKIDEFVTSKQREYEDRFGNKHYTVEGLRWVAQQAISAFGYITLKSFQLGAPLPDNELTLPNQVLQDESDGEYYRWDGTFPKAVPADSTPDTTGGKGIGAWVSVGDASLRSQISEPDGLKFIGTCPDITTLRTIEPERDQQKIFVDFHTTGMKPTVSGDTGGGLFVADFTDSTSADDNGMVIVTAGGKRWKRDLQGKGYVTPRMFGAWMDAPKVDVHDINHDTDMPKPDLTGVTNDSAALIAAYNTYMPIFIDSPIYIGDASIDITVKRWDGYSLNIYGTNPLHSVIYTSGDGGFICAAWCHELSVENIGFVNADDGIVGCPLVISGDSALGQPAGGGQQYKINNVNLMRYNVGLALSCFVSESDRVFMYSCNFGMTLVATSINLSAAWALRCGVGFCWGATYDRASKVPAFSDNEVLMYVAANNIAADMCITPHKFFRGRDLKITGLGIEGVRGDTLFDFSSFAETERSAIYFDAVDCWIQTTRDSTVTSVVKTPDNVTNVLGMAVFQTGMIKTDRAVQFFVNSNDSNINQCRGFEIKDTFRFVSSVTTSKMNSAKAQSVKINGRWYGTESSNSISNNRIGAVLSAANYNSNAFFNNVSTDAGTVIVPYGASLDIFLTAVGEESLTTGGNFLCVEAIIFPVGKSGVSASGSGGRILATVSGTTQADISSAGNIWTNYDQGDKNLTGINVVKQVVNGGTYIRFRFDTPTLTMAIVHLTVTRCGYTHSYDKLWQVRNP